MTKNIKRRTALKNITPFYYSLFAIPAATSLRCLQYVRLIDTEGFYTLQSTTDTVLRYSVPAVIVLTVLFSLIIMITDKEQAQFNLTRSVGIVYIVYGLLLAVESGVRAAARDVISALAMAAAVYFCIEGIVAIKKGKRGGLISLLSMFAPAYFIGAGIKLFFDTVAKANSSAVRLEMLGLCAAALLFAALGGAGAGMNIPRSRIKALALIGALIMLCPVATRFMALSEGLTAISLVTSVRDAIGGVTAVVILFNVCMGGKHCIK